jgi:outer membrane lipoprotein-sorting protein
MTTAHALHLSATKTLQVPIMRSLFAFLTLIVLAFAGPLHAAAIGEAEKADLARVSDYLNTMRSVEGRFTQISPGGKSEGGTFYLRKPGRLRFEYDQPNPNLIVADGSTIAVSNTRLKTTDRYPLTDSPLRLLLSENVNLAADRRISNVRKEPGQLMVTARQDTGPAQGQITLYFADSGSSLELRQWEVLDAQGLRTMVAISGLKQAANLNPRLFVIQELSPFRQRR